MEDGDGVWGMVDGGWRVEELLPPVTKPRASGAWNWVKNISVIVTY